MDENQNGEVFIIKALAYQAVHDCIAELKNNDEEKIEKS